MDNENNSKELGMVGLDSEGNPLVREPIKVSLSEFKNSKYLDIRKVYNRDGVWLPTSKGITLTYDTFETILEILNRDKDEIKEWIKNDKK